MSDVNIEVFQEHDAAAESFLSSEVNDCFYELLALLILRVGLPGDDELYRMFRMTDDPLQPVRVPEEEGSPLIRGEAAGKADRESLRGQDFSGSLNLGRRCPLAPELFGQTTTDKAHQIFPASLVGAPQLGAGDLLYLLPDMLVIRIFRPVRPQVPVEEHCHIPREPRGDVDAIRYVVDGHILNRVMVPDILPYLSRDPAVKPADPICMGGESQSEGTHTKGLGFIPGIETAVTQQHLKADSQSLTVVLDVGPNQLRIKDVVPRWDRGMYGKNRGGQDKFPGRIKGEAFFISEDVL